MPIQIIPAAKSFSSEFGKAVGTGLGSGFSEGISKKFEHQHEMEKLSHQSNLKRKETSEKLKGESESENKNYETIENLFGKEMADFWKASTVGGRTELEKQILNSFSRGDDLSEMFNNVEAPEEELTPIDQKTIPQIKNGNISKDFDWPDYKKRPKGYTPQGWDKERQAWRKENAPIYESVKTKIQSNKRDELGIKKLTKLNDSGIAEGFERILINPETGDFYGPAQLSGLISPEAQEWVKEIARFQNRAKDAFGSRVTNFDLQSYMKQFPGLMNTPDGRKHILRMMDINNKLDNLYDSTLNKIYEKYGLSGISQEKANQLAESMIKDETERLRHEYLGIDAENEKLSSNLSGKMINVIGPNGELYEVDESEVDQLPEGYRIE